MPLERHPTDPDKLVFRAHKFVQMFTLDELNAAVAEERKACAKVAVGHKFMALGVYPEERNRACDDIASAILARGQS
jgi:hypothetical protein